MAVDADVADFHREQAEQARNLYNAAFSSEDGADVWRTTKSELRAKVTATFAASNNLKDIESALCKSAGHISVLRRLMAPPISQDQFKLLCSHYSKGSENKGTPIRKSNAAEAIFKSIMEWRDREMTAWLDESRDPTDSEKAETIEALALLMAPQEVATTRRNIASAKQEAAIIELLKDMRWSQESAPLITQPSQLLARQFMHKTRFATKSASQEVDIACGLGGTGVILAMECKVTNDATNSVKRVNDVLKKAKAWQDHWGSFVKTAALLQGVIAYKDVHRLLEDNVVVFWSHRLDDFRSWLNENVS